MLDISEYYSENELVVRLSGRIDGISSEELNKHISQLLDAGRRRIILDFNEVNYVSSAGLRVLLINQKKISGAQGEIIIYQLSPQIYEVFKLSGFLKLFKVVEKLSEPDIVQSVEESVQDLTEHEIDGIKYSIIKSNFKSTFEKLGDKSLLELSSYEEKNHLKKITRQSHYGFGTYAIGDDWSAICDYFGEGMIIDGNLFVLPAAKRSAVDYMLAGSTKSNVSYSAHESTEFTGECAYKISFDASKSYISIDELLSSISGIIKMDFFGFTIIGESKGLMGINLKKVPLSKNKPQNNLSIFDLSNFPDWFDYPVEEEYFNHLIAGTGIYANNNQDRARFDLGEKSSHLHYAVFERKLLSFGVQNYNDELQTIINDLTPVKLMHNIKGSRLSMGSIAIYIPEV
ncbi:hypothetical protein MASR1M45_20320 [Candidatus Kapaibacterium sp.]